ncbi:hypothetical protein JCM9140_1634 [Halalkalibacter wakoensis JCM 9140]|uniref:DUF3006 domain-containing protein n=1 Tax=Halalkalibacter wakoensis JCM 9140 TaxID=1236970 RepID=W4Q0X1_9BACI|nr:DUF3006 domain-containing protein [Halalkalibacter wakoensis]GAE25627.1 hypothetical protein JCM9140_1634 [Halalkalibacter wakoensis JCM 9140]
MVKGVMDRIVDQKKAVILVESLKKEIVIDQSKLPSGSKVGTWFQLEIKDEVVQTIEIDEAETKSRRRGIADKLQQVKASQKQSRFQRRKGE